LEPEEPPPPPRNRWVWALVVVVAIAALVVFVVLPDGGGVDGRLRTGANVRAGPSFFSERVGGLSAGAEVEVECDASGPGESGRPIIWDRLASGEFEGRFVADGLIDLDGEPPEC
jgi:hypothetical protein